MIGSLREFEALTAAEDYFAFFALPYDAAIVRVGHVQLLRRFGYLIRQNTLAYPDAAWEERRRMYRLCLRMAYRAIADMGSKREIIDCEGDRTPGPCRLCGFATTCP